MAGLAQSVERVTAERKVAGSIPGTRPLLRVLNNREMKVFLLHSKRLDLRVARITT